MGELILIAVVALLFLGPDKLPSAAKAIGRGIRDIKKQTRELQTTLEDDQELGDAVRDLRSAMRGEDPPPPRRRPIPQPPAPGAPGPGPAPEAPGTTPAGDAALEPPRSPPGNVATEPPAKPTAAPGAVARGELPPDTPDDDTSAHG